MAGFCGKCGAKLRDKSQFCPACGATVKKSAPAAERVLKCASCGTPLRGDEEFCGECGASVKSAVSGVQKIPPKQSEPPVCPSCGAPLLTAVRFCGECGADVSSQFESLRTAGEPSAVKETAPKRNKAETVRAVVNAAKAVEKSVFFAPNFAGEFELGTVSMIPNPASVISGGFKSLLTSLKSFFKNPKAFIPTLLISAVWLTLNILKANGIDPVPTQILSVLTFSNAGFSDNALNIVGGVLGKGVFAAALVSLIGIITNKNKGQRRGVGEVLFKSFGVDSQTLGAYIFGAGLALMLFVFMSGNDVNYTSVMGGAAAAFASARSALNGGFLSRLFASFEQKSVVKTAEGIPRGMAAGFAAAALLGLIPNFTLALLVSGIAIAFIGAVVMILQKLGVLGAGRREAAAL